MCTMRVYLFFFVRLFLEWNSLFFPLLKWMVGMLNLLHFICFVVLILLKHIKFGSCSIVMYVVIDYTSQILYVEVDANKRVM